MLKQMKVASPVGELTLVASSVGLVAVLWPQEPPGRVPLASASYDETDPTLQRAAAQLAEYFAGSRRDFDLPLDPQGTTFQKAVWQGLRRIPYGTTRSYGQLAQELGNPTASRAVGAANGRNPLSIIVPCHRVIGANGTLTGFAGGLEAKRLLLQLEGVSPNQ